MKQINLLLITLLASLILGGCNKMSSDSNGVFVDDIKVYDLKSAFVGGGVADPNEGSSYRCSIFSGYYSECPNYKKVMPQIHITGFRYVGKEYTEKGDFIDAIYISNIPSVGDLSIPMKQGKYEGGNELVSSVSFNPFDRGVYGKNGWEKAQCVINIVLKDNRKIDIRYVGNTPWDGLDG